MCNSDLITRHNIYQSAVRWSEGDAAVGAKPKQTKPSSSPNTDSVNLKPGHHQSSTLEPPAQPDPTTARRVTFATLDHHL
jgi:hypothetical protein